MDLKQLALEEEKRTCDVNFKTVIPFLCIPSKKFTFHLYVVFGIFAHRPSILCKLPAHSSEVAYPRQAKRPGIICSFTS